MIRSSDGPVTGPSLTLLRNTFLVLALAFPASTGCSFLMRGAEAPQARGSWTGRVVAVSVQNFKGEVFDAAALDVEAGPKVPFTVAADRGGGRRPLLTRWDGVGSLVIVLASDAPVGMRVQVKGVSLSSTPSRKGAEGGADPVFRPRPGVEDPQLFEHILMVDGAFRVLGG